MNVMITILTEREVVMLLIGCVTYIALFVVTVQNSRKKMLLLQERLNKVRAMQEEQQATSLLNVEANRKKIDELEKLLKKLGDENSVLRLELEEKMARLDYTNKVAQIELEKRTQAESVVTESDVYRRMNELAGQGRTMGTADWQQLEELVNRVYTNFTARLLSLYPMSPQDFRVTLLTKVHILPKDIATLTAHSKESVASTRSRLYQKVFGRKGSSKDWDDFVLSL